MEEFITQIDVDHYNAIGLQNREGIYGLYALQKGQNDVNYLKWTFLSVWRNGKPTPGETKRPMAVRLGDKAKAIEVVEKILKELKGEK